MRKKNLNIKFLRKKHLLIKKKFEKRLQDELNYEPEIVKPRFERIKIKNKNGEESYRAPLFLPEIDYLYKTVK